MCKCMCAYMYMYVCLRVYICVHMCVHVCFHKRACVHASVGMCVCVLYMCTHVFVWVCARTRAPLSHIVWRWSTLSFRPGHQCFQSHSSRAGCLSSSVCWTNRLLQRWQCFSLSISAMWPLAVSEFQGSPYSAQVPLCPCPRARAPQSAGCFRAGSRCVDPWSALPPGD